MNYSDLRFVSITLGVGLGLGAAMARRHGFVGFVSGFALVVVASLTLLTVVRLLLRSNRKNGGYGKPRSSRHKTLE